MRLSIFAMAILAITTLFPAGCQTDPQTKEGKENLHTNVDATLKRLYLVDPGLESFLNKSYGYVVFPSVDKAGFIAGGAYGRGEVFEHITMMGAHFIGYADISQATVAHRPVEKPSAKSSLSRTRRRCKASSKAD